jgi:osmotically-inducible protein OsmY
VLIKEYEMRSDDDLRADLLERLDSIASINGADIDVWVDNGKVTLTGRVDTPQTRFQVERAVRRVTGLRSLALNVTPGRDKGRKGLH